MKIYNAMTHEELKQAHEDQTWLIREWAGNVGHRQLVKIFTVPAHCALRDVEIVHVRRADGRASTAYRRYLRPATARDLLELGEK